MKKYYRRIRDLREDRDWTQTQIAEMLHVTQKVYSNYETGRTLVPSDILIELADIHGTSMDYLAERTDSPYFEKISYFSGDIRQSVTSLSDTDQP